MSEPVSPVRPWQTKWRFRGDSRDAILSREVLLVLGLTLGYSAIRAVMSIIATLTQTRNLSSMTVVLNAPDAPGRPILSLFLELRGIFFGYFVPAMLAIYLLNRDRDWAPGTPRVGVRLGLERSPRRFDALSGVALAAIIGIPGLALYFAARAADLNVNIAAADLHDWWAIPVLILAAAGNGVLEEVIVVGYLLTRLPQVGWGVAAAVTFSALLRGTYHLYQGFGGFVGNAIMGVIFALFYLRFKRLWPLIIAHTVLDVVAFLGYTLLRDHVPWL